MNAREMVARLNDLDDRLCRALGLPRPGDAATLDEAITMSAATTDRLLVGDDKSLPATALVEFLAAQV